MLEKGSSMYTAFLEGSLVLSKTGEWWHEGVIFQNERLSGLFHRSIQFDSEHNAYVVRIGAQQATFTCEDTPYFVSALIETPSGPTIRLLDGSEEPLNQESLTVGAESQIYCTVKGGHRARLTRGAHQDLADKAIDESRVRICGQIIELKKHE